MFHLLYLIFLFLAITGTYLALFKVDYKLNAVIVSVFSAIFWAMVAVGSQNIEVSNGQATTVFQSTAMNYLGLGLFLLMIALAIVSSIGYAKEI